MNRQRALKILLVLVGLAFLAGAYPLTMSVLGASRLTPPEEMILAIYAPIGVFLLLAVRHPAANRTLIACVGWSTLLHAAVMLLQSFQNRGEPGQMPFSTGLAIASAVLVVLAPARQAGSPLPAEAALPRVPAIGAGEMR